MHSQNNEERIIANYFGPSFRGTFLDIGANDGKTFSNTRALALAGWSGTCVDPSPNAFASLSALYADSPNVQCLEVAITTKDGTIILHQASDTLVSSLEASHADQWKAYNFTWEAVPVKGVTFDTLLSLSTVKTFDMINIDAEGHDLEILAQMNLDALGCKLLCIEHGGHADKIRAIVPQMRTLALNDINLILAR